MSTTKLLLNRIMAGVGIVALLVAGYIALSPQARADVIFLTRQNRIMSTYPSYDAFSIGTSTNPGSGTATSTTGIGKLTVLLPASDSFLNTLDGYRKAFEIASTTTAGGTATTTADIFVVKNSGCVQTVATSSATPVKMNFLTVATTSASGFVTWSYGTCS